MFRAFPVYKILGAALVLGLTLAEARPGAGQTSEPAGAPEVQNAVLSSRTATGGLESAIRDAAAEAAGKPFWLGYLVDQISGQNFSCCGTSDEDHRCGLCRLERNPENDFSSSSPRSGQMLKLEQGKQIAVLFRLEANQIQRIRVASAGCTLDAGGLRFIWLNGIAGTESVLFLKSYAQKFDDSRQLANEALTAIAFHRDPAADRAFDEFTIASEPEKLRKQAAFWLGAARGAHGLAGLQNMARKDPSPEVRSQVAFGLYVSKEPSAVEEMIRMARQDESAHVRGQALFWLAQKAGQRALGAITSAIDSDPDTEIKKKAVFALSQMPRDEGIPKLIEVAEKNPNREVRKQAMFWLGQSHDSRALDFFEKILSR
jgi:hypothetical protein